MLLFAQGGSIDSLEISLKRSSNRTEKAELYNKISDKYLDVDLSIARQYADSAIFLGTGLNNYEILSDAWVNYANTYYYTGNFDSALICYEKSYAIILKSHNKLEIASALNRLGLIYEAKSDFAKSTEYYFESLEIYEDLKDQKGMADLFNNLGVIHDNFGLEQQAIDYYDLSLKNYKALNNREGQANIYNNLSSHYSNSQDLDSALYYLMIAKDIFLEINKMYAASTSIYNISTLYFDKEMFDSSRYYLDSALIIYEFQGNQNGIANIYNQKAKIYSNEKDFVSALTSLHECLDIRIEVGNLQAKSQTLLDLSDLYIKVGDYNNGYKFYIEYSEIKDSIYDESVSSKISELNIKYETQKNEKKIVLLEKEAEIKKNYNRFLIVGLIALFLISVLLFTFFRIKIKLSKSDRKFFEQQKFVNKLKMDKKVAENMILEKEVQRQLETNKLQEQKYLNELEHRNRELVTLTIHLLNKNKALTDVSELLKNSFAEDKQKSRLLKELLKKVDDNLNLDSDWDQFKLHFENVNVGFFEKLQNRHPDLSTGDLKVCAYIKINLSIKEIAQMMNISVAGINKRLYRIRKKIDLDSRVNISKYLTEL